MAAAVAPPSPNGQALVPPDERFWTRYSPHYELPLAGAASVMLHGLALAALMLGGLAYLFSGGEESKPPRMQMVMVEGLGEGGIPGLDGEPGLPGTQGPAERSERTVQAEPPDQNQAALTTKLPIQEPATDDQLVVPTPSVLEATPNDALIEDLQGLLTDADQRVKDIEKAKQDAAKAKELADQAKRQKDKAAIVASVAGPNNRGGNSRPGGQGGGGGRGNKFGAGTGTGGAGGSATKQEILAWRWRFDLTGGGREHAEKLHSVGVTVAFPDPLGGFLVVHDLSKRPVQLKKDSLAAYKDAVKWYNTKPESVQALAQELRLPFVPRFVMLLLPKDREEKMAAEEARFAEAQGRSPQAVRATWFDFRLQGGSFEPVALKQE